ncbi:MAG: hypothetical protein JWN89_469 [Parcubacteria group bacterium]|nr:hypothetical protein [Parcubacteria group bacterium]
MEFVFPQFRKLLPYTAVFFCLAFFLAFAPQAKAMNIVYNFNNDTVGQPPLNMTVATGTFVVANQSILGKSLHATKAGGDNAITLDGFASSSDYSVTWKDAYDTTGRRQGFMLRTQTVDSAVPTVKQGYLFQVNHGGALSGANMLRIYRYDSTFTILQSTALTSVSPRWYRAVVAGPSLGFYYSDDGVNFTVVAASSTDSTFTSGGVQYHTGSGTAVDGDAYVDDITQGVASFNDTTGPVISSIASTTVSTTATVTWTTDENSNSKVSYGTSSGSYTISSTTAAYSTSHSVGLTGLSASTRYYYVVVSADFYGNISTSTEKTLTAAGGSGTITLSSPKTYQVIQRNGSGLANISIAGTYTYSGTPVAMEASFNGGAYATIAGSLSGGTFAGTLSNQTQGQGTLTVRLTNDTSVSTSISYVGIGDIFVVAGQSNASGRGVTNNSYSHASLKATMFGNNDTWADLTDPLDSSTGQVDSISTDTFSEMGSPYPLVATSFLADQSVPIAFIPVAKGGSSMSEWARSLATTTLYGSMYRRINAAGGSIKGILWFQGESDADHGVDHGSGLGATRANYLADLTALANNVNSDFGSKLIVTQLAYSGAPPHVTYLDDVRLAQKDAWDAGGNVLAGPAFPDVNLADQGGDTIHFKSDSDQLIQANRLWASLKKDFYSGTDGRGPRLASLNWGTSRAQILATFTDDTLPLLPASTIGGFAVTDSVGVKTISSATRTANGVITLTLSSAATGATTVNLATMNTGIGVSMPTDSSSINLPAEIFQNEPVTDATAPTVSVTAPADGATVSGSSVSVTATAADNLGVSGVQFKLDNINLGSEDTTSTYGITWDSTSATNGSHVLVAVARDAAGNYATSSSITVTVSNTDAVAPTVSLTAPSNGATVSGSSVAVSATASDNVGVFGVQFKLDNLNLGSEDTTSAYGITWDTTSATNGSHTLVAVARDAAGNYATSSSVTVTVSNADAVPPTVSLTAPSNGATVSGSSVSVTSTASDNIGVSGVQFKLDSVNLGSEDTTSTYGITWDSTSASNGTHTLVAVARDAAGNYATSSSITVTVSNVVLDTTAPTVSVTAPTNGAIISGSSVSVTANASDNIGVSGVQFKLDNINLGFEDITSTYGITWNSTSATDGSHILVAVARDAAGNYATSSSITVTVSNSDTTPPTVSISTPGDGVTVSGGAVSVTASASDNISLSGVQFKLDGAVLNAEDTSSPYGITWDTTGVSNGNYTLLAVARDLGGNRATSSPITVTVSNSASRPGSSGGGGGGGGGGGSPRPPASPTPAVVAPAPTSPLLKYPKDFVDFIATYKSFYNQARALGIVLPQNVLEVLAYLNAQPTVTTASSFSVSRSPDLTLGSRGAAVVELQKFLISQNKGSASFTLSTAGATGLFGQMTRSALAEFQQRAGISPALGYFGPLTKAYIAKLGF